MRTFPGGWVGVRWVGWLGVALGLPCAGQGRVPAEWVKESALPEGPGWAQGYPVDAGIRGHASAMFTEDFEASEYRTRWDEVRDEGGAGLRPEGDERFSTALEPWGNWGKWPAPGRWNFYSYWHEMSESPDGKYWGNSFLPEGATDIPKDRWICAEFMVRHNTPGERDGEQAFWIDGRRMGHWRGISWRRNPELFANALTLESYVTDRWTKNPTNVVYFDNLVIAREYIGPMGGTPDAGTATDGAGR